MTSNAKPPVLATPTVLEVRSAWRLNNSINSRKPSDIQDVAAAIVARRYRLSPCLARIVCELAQIGGQAA
jgi:hypothetical protein